MGSSDGGMESEDEAVLATPPAEKRSINTRSSGKKEPPPVYKTLLAPKRQAKTSLKGEGSQKKPKGK